MGARGLRSGAERMRAARGLLLLLVLAHPGLAQGKKTGAVKAFCCTESDREAAELSPAEEEAVFRCFHSRVAWSESLFRVLLFVFA